MLAQIKAGYSSNDKRNQTNSSIFSISIIHTKTLQQQFNQVIIIIGVHIDDKKLVIMEPKAFLFAFTFSKDGDRNLQYENDYIIKHNEFLAEQIIKIEIV